MSVTLSFVVEIDGLPRDIKVDSGTLGAELDQKAIETLRKWNFAPAMMGDKPVATMTKIQFVLGSVVGDKLSASTPQPATNNQAPAPAISPTGTIMVQIAAVSSQDVADILLASLQKKGYSVSVRHEPQDKLLHVQIGPFATRQDAEAMQQRVLADGFNAIVK